MTNVQKFMELDGLEIRDRLTKVVEYLNDIEKAAGYDDTSACESLATLALLALVQSEHATMEKEDD